MYGSQHGSPSGSSSMIMGQGGLYTPLVISKGAKRTRNLCAGPRFLADARNDRTLVISKGAKRTRNLYTPLVISKGAKRTRNLCTGPRFLADARNDRTL